MPKVTEPEFTRLAERVATATKTEKLRHLPGMDAVALALNCGATDAEIAVVKKILRLVEQAGYEIHRQGVESCL